MELGKPGLDLIKQFEGCARRRPDGRFEAYPDPGTGKAPWTIGWGATGLEIKRGLIWTQLQCDQRLANDIAQRVRAVNAALRLPSGNVVPTSQNQFDALVAFHFNTGGIAKATLTELHREGKFASAANEFGRWVNGGGKRMAGLVRRRAAEAALYRS